MFNQDKNMENTLAFYYGLITPRLLKWIDGLLQHQSCIQCPGIIEVPLEKFLLYWYIAANSCNIH